MIDNNKNNNNNQKIFLHDCCISFEETAVSTGSVKKKNYIKKSDKK